MSSNNEIVIIEKYRTIEVHENFCVDNEFIPKSRSLLKKFKKSEALQAIKFAQEYCNKEMIEYGIRFIKEGKA